MTYVDTAYADAVARGLTPEQVAGSTYAQVANACGIALGANGESALDFRFNSIRRKVALRLQQDAEEADQVALKAKAKTFADANGLRYMRVAEGESATFTGVLVGRPE
jgi:hypothetical protein